MKKEDLDKKNNRKQMKDESRTEEMKMTKRERDQERGLRR